MPAGISAWKPIANTTLTSSAASITFSGITQVYRDLVLVVYGQVPNNDEIRFSFNGNTSASISWFWAEGNGATAASGTNSSSLGWLSLQGTGNSGQQWVANVTLFDYSATDRQKLLLSRFDSPDWRTNMLTSRWPSNSAVTSIKITPQLYGFSAGSTFALYGVSA